MAWALAVGKFFKGMPEMMAATVPHFFSASKVSKWMASPSRVCTVGKLAVMYWQSSGSSSTQISRLAGRPFASSMRVMQPVPGPISTTNSSVFWMASSAAFVMQAARYLELGAMVPMRVGSSSILFRKTLLSLLHLKRSKYDQTQTNTMRKKAVVLFL